VPADAENIAPGENTFIHDKMDSERDRRAHCRQGVGMTVVSTQQGQGAVDEIRRAYIVLPAMRV
jgi:hypothetical protein